MEIYYILHIIQFIFISILILVLGVILYIMNKKSKEDKSNSSIMESYLIDKINIAKDEQFENIDCFEQKLIIKLLKLERKINNMEKSFLNKEYVEKYEYNHKIFEIQDRITYIENNYHH